MDIKRCVDCPHTQRVLQKAGINDMESLAAMTYEDLLKLRGVGPVIAGDLMKRVEEWRQSHAEQTVSGNDRL